MLIPPTSKRCIKLPTKSGTGRKRMAPVLKALILRHLAQWQQSWGRRRRPDNQKNLVFLSIIHGFRQRGHLLSTTNPIRPRRDRTPHLDLTDYNLSNEDLNKSLSCNLKKFGMKGATLLKSWQARQIYCGNIGVEYAHIENRERRMWLESGSNKEICPVITGWQLPKKRRTLEKLNGAVIFERFLHTKYVG